MEELKCKSCGGTLEKDGNVYICQNCGEAFKINTENISEYQLCDVVLTELPNKMSAIKVVKDLTGCDLIEAKNCIDKAAMNIPYIYKKLIPKAEALRITKMFSESGNRAEVV